MQGTRNHRGRSDAYTPEQIEAILDKLGIEVNSETSNDFLCYCPFHGNRFTPSFSVSRTHGTYLCFNASCGASGSFIDLIQKIGKIDIFRAKRMILSVGDETKASFTDRFKATMEKVPTFQLWTPGKPPKDGNEVVARMKQEFWQSEPALEYMRGRGFTDETLDYFDVGYSHVKDLLAVPMHDPKGQFPVGVVGRSLVDKRFKNSVGLPTSKTLWNFHRAKKAGETVIITEASFDAMRVHQAGFPYVVACLGGNFSPHHAEQLNRTFTKIILMSDFDDRKKYVYDNCRKCAKKSIKWCVGHNPGRDLGHTISETVVGKRVFWASYEDRTVYPHGAKDAGDLTDDEIRQCIKNAVSNLTYNQWGLY